MKLNLSAQLVLLFSITILFLKCDSSITESAADGIIHQISGCNKSYSRSPESDSCFTYTFRETLKIDFCVPGNCCPDSNRFSFKSGVFKDTITIVFADTAANLCRCICNYTIQAEFDNLIKDFYLVKCQRKDSLGVYTSYREKVYRQIK